MKRITIILAFHLIAIFSNGQLTGQLFLQSARPKSGAANICVYQPPWHLALPRELYLSFVFDSGGTYHFKKLLLQRVGSRYQIAIKVASSVKVAIAGIFDEKGNLIDNNTNLGFILYFDDKTGKISASARISAGDLLSYYAIRPLQLDYQQLKHIMIGLFQQAYELSPAVEKDDIYTYYLTLLFEEKKDIVKNKLLSYARLMASSTNNETEWIRAIKIYHVLGMSDSVQAVQQKAIMHYPNGMVARMMFLDDFEKNDTTASLVIKAIKEYSYRFKDTSNQMKYTFYGSLIGYLLAERKWSETFSYELMMPDKLNLAHIYNNVAWQLSGGDQFDFSDSDINMAKILSKKSVDNLSDLMAQYPNKDEDDGTAERVYSRFVGTYALILYKVGQYDSAFYYENLIYQMSKKSDVSVFDRLVLYARKAKGPQFTYHFIKTELANNLSSPIIIYQLENLAKH